MDDGGSSKLRWSCKFLKSPLARDQQNSSTHNNDASDWGSRVTTTSLITIYIHIHMPMIRYTVLLSSSLVVLSNVKLMGMYGHRHSRDDIWPMNDSLAFKQEVYCPVSHLQANREAGTRVHSVRSSHACTYALHRPYIYTWDILFLSLGVFVTICYMFPLEMKKAPYIKLFI